ncbi:MAG: Hsp20/alpha crystallin family protein [Planctomycetales bacterium]
MVTYRRAYPLDALQSQLEKAFLELFPNGGRCGAPSRPSEAFPALNAWEDEDHLFVEAETPGVKMEDLEISLLGTELTLQGKREFSAGEDAAYHQRERSAGEFKRSLELPVEVRQDAVEATLRDGVLLLKLPKAEVAKPRKIEVKPQ